MVLDILAETRGVYVGIHGTLYYGLYCCGCIRTELSNPHRMQGHPGPDIAVLVRATPRYACYSSTVVARGTDDAPHGCPVAVEGVDDTVYPYLVVKVEAIGDLGPAQGTVPKIFVPPEYRGVVYANYNIVSPGVYVPSGFHIDMGVREVHGWEQGTLVPIRK